jgi:hypothetical protein
MFSPQIVNPTIAYSLPLHPHSLHLPTPNLAPQPANIITPQPIQPTLLFTQNFSPQPNSSYLVSMPCSTLSQNNSSS